VMSLEDMVSRFDIHNLTPSPAAINFSKLDHFNSTHIRLLQANDLAARIRPYFLGEGLNVDDAKLMNIIPLIRERLVTLDDCLSFASWFFKETVVPNPSDLVAKNLTATQSIEIARKLLEILSGLTDFKTGTTEPPLRALVEQLGLSPNQVFGILRVAVTGQIVSPPLFEGMEIVGKEKVIERLRNAIEILEKLE
jgi:glutamyl-tRNA synthetase